MAITIVGLGPAGLERLDENVKAKLLDPDTAVIVRTLDHPAAEQLAQRRAVVSCDDLYHAGTDPDAVYEAIANRVLDAARRSRVVYGVPGSALVGERTVARLRAGADIELVAGESFLDLAFAALNLDPITAGVQILDAKDLPDPLPLHLPTLITQVDGAFAMGETALELGKVLAPTTDIVVLDSLGDPDERVETVELADLPRHTAGPRTTLFVDPPPVGWHGLVQTNRRLRRECPWDREQTHHTLVSHLVEEAYETVDAVGRLGEDAPGGQPDPEAYVALEEELGDVLLQVVFHAVLAEEAAAFSVEEVAEGIRRKLVHRHPHVFGDVVADTAEVVRANWETIKAGEKDRASLMDDIPVALPALTYADKAQRRAASVGFDWPNPQPVVATLAEEVDELRHAVAAGVAVAISDEIGDVLFSAVNACRHLHVDPEVALRAATERFMTRFRHVEDAAGSRLGDLSLGELDALWDAAKRNE